MINRLRWLDWRRRWRRQRVRSGALADFLDAALPPPGRTLADSSYVSLDLETTGGNAGRDRIVSVGWVLVDRHGVDLTTARHRLVANEKALTAGSVVIHGITDDELRGAPPLVDVLTEVLAVLRGKVLLAHHARTEQLFLAAACRLCFGHAPIIPAIDTLQLAARVLPRNIRETPGIWRLSNLRRAFHLPPHPAHDALGDAIATGELFLALARALPAGPRSALAPLLY